MKHYLGFLRIKPCLMSEHRISVVYFSKTICIRLAKKKKSFSNCISMGFPGKFLEMQITGPRKSCRGRFGTPAGPLHPLYILQGPGSTSFPGAHTDVCRLKGNDWLPRWLCKHLPSDLKTQHVSISLSVSIFNNLITRESSLECTFFSLLASSPENAQWLKSTAKQEP